MNLITEHLDILTAAQTPKTNGGRGRGKNTNDQSLHGIKKMRELILELAVRGKLVPQDPDDEPASVLLEKIAKEKARLIKEGKIKKQKPLPEIGEDEKPFDLPVGWEWTRLGTVSEIKGGKRLPTGHSFSPVETPYIYIQVTNMKGGTITEDNLKYISQETLSEIARYVISKDDLYITIAGTIGVVGIVPENFDGMNLTENAAKIVFSEVNKKWLQKILSSQALQKQFKNKTNQLAQPKLALHRVASSCMALPPLSEQHRIVAKVAELMALCDQMEQQQTDSNATHQTLVENLLAILTNAADQEEFSEVWQRIADHFDTLFTTEQSIDHLKQTILQLAVMGKLVPQYPNDESASLLLEKIAKEKARLIKEGKIKKQKPLAKIPDTERPFELPVGWQWARLGESIESMTNGIYKPSKFYDDKGFMCLRMYNIKKGEINFENIKRMILDREEITQYGLMSGDLLVNRVNSRELVGKAAVIPELFEPTIFESKNIRVRFFPDGIFPNYINIFFQTQEVRAVFEDDAKQTCGQASINQPQIRNLVAPIPPLAEQHRIVAKVDELMALCDNLKARLNDAQAIQMAFADAILEKAVASEFGKNSRGLA